MYRITNWKYHLVIALLAVTLCSCLKKTEHTDSSKHLIKNGTWRAVISTQTKSIPFICQLEKGEKGDLLYLINGSEKLLSGTLVRRNDSIIIPMHIFDAAFELRQSSEDELSGFFVKYNTPSVYRLPIRLSHGDSERFKSQTASAGDLSGKWDVTFTNQSGDSTKAIGTFLHQNNQVTGSFLTQTGDYRYLEGQLSEGNLLELSTFDGEHLYLFEAHLAGDSLVAGQFWSGKTGYRTWTAFKDPEVKLPDPDTLTYLKSGYETVSFSLPDLDGHIVSLDDERFHDKVVIVQILGSWCPNCMDETKFFAQLYDDYRDSGLEIVGLSFERSEKLEDAAPLLRRMTSKLEVDYPILFGGKIQDATKTLPMLNHVMSFPTSIVLTQQKKVAKIHTGFRGPGTGAYYDEFTEDFTLFIEKLLNPDE